MHFSMAAAAADLKLIYQVSCKGENELCVCAVSESERLPDVFKFIFSSFTPSTLVYVCV
jgi:hypothetical protein